MTFSLPSNDATDDIIYMPSDLPFLENLSSREQAAERLQKLVSLEDFGVRWGFTSRTHRNKKGKEVEKYKSYGKDDENERHACAEQYAAFRDVFENFIHPEAYWELDEDETWFGMCEDSIISWYESMIREISITLLDRNQSYSAALMHSDIPGWCREIHEKITPENTHLIYDASDIQFPLIPEVFRDTLWADVVEVSQILIAFIAGGHALPEIPFLQEERIQKFHTNPFSCVNNVYSPLDEILQRWKPSDHNSYEISKKVDAARDNKSVPFNNIMRISRKRLYRTLEEDVGSYLVDNEKRTTLSPRAREDTHKYLSHDTIIYALMQKIEHAWRSHFGERMVFVDSSPLISPEEIKIMKRIQLAQGPIPGNDDEDDTLSIVPDIGAQDTNNNIKVQS